MVVLVRHYGTYENPPCEATKDEQDEMLDGIGYDGSHLTIEARLFLWECGWRPEDIIPNYNPDEYANSPLYEWREVIEVVEPSEDEVLA